MTSAVMGLQDNIIKSRALRIFTSQKSWQSSEGTDRENTLQVTAVQEKTKKHMLDYRLHSYWFVTVNSGDQQVRKRPETLDKWRENPTESVRQRLSAMSMSSGSNQGLKNLSKTKHQSKNTRNNKYVKRLKVKVHFRATSRRMAKRKRKKFLKINGNHLVTFTSSQKHQGEKVLFVVQVKTKAGFCGETNVLTEECFDKNNI